MDINFSQNKDVIKEFKDFQKRSRKKYKSLINRIKDERKYLSGDQYSKEDIDLLGKDRTSNKLNVVKNVIRTISNTYRETTYRWKVTDVATNKDSIALNQFGLNFLHI